MAALFFVAKNFLIFFSKIPLQNPVLSALDERHFFTQP